MLQGWPNDTGPLQTLTRLGNLPRGEKPTWFNGYRATRQPNGDQRTVYETAIRRGLVPKEIVDLAALILEGYDVRTYPRGRWTHILITEPEGQ